jgi:hypothetical protein
VGRSSHCCLVVTDAIELVVRRLSTLPPSPKVESLQTKAQEYLRVPEGWNVTPPTAEDRDRLMKRVLRLHVEVAKLEREVAAGG